MLIDIRLLELLASKVCHDLISPVGAINNGIELVEDIGGSVINEAMKLISSSAQQAAKRLRLFRMAYGKAGSENGITLKDIRNTAKDYLSTSKSKLEWGEEISFGEFTEKRGFLKTLLCMTMMGEDVLSHGGAITVENIIDGGVLLTASGSHAQMSEAILSALKGETAIEDITPRTVHAYVTARLAEHYGLKLTAEQVSPEKVNLRLLENKEVTAS